MITTKDVEKLAELSRIKLDEGEKAGLVKEIDAVLAYVDVIKNAKVSLDQSETVGMVKNATRADTPRVNSAESGADRERLIASAPDREGDFVAVKKIL